MKNKLLTVVISLFLVLGLLQSNTNIINAEDTTDYLCFTAEEANSTVKLIKFGTPTVVSLETSTDKVNWTPYTFDTVITLTNIGDKVYFRNSSSTTTGFSVDAGNTYQFVMSGKITGSGDVTTLINKNGTLDLSSAGESCFCALFSGCSSLIYPPNLPATILSKRCYTGMFQGCTNMAIAPELPAINLADWCYDNIFNSCTSLTVPPELPATSIPEAAYNGLFYVCTGIKAPPVLPGTTLGDDCYGYVEYMFTNIEISATQDLTYSIPYRIPSNGTITCSPFPYQTILMFAGVNVQDNDSDGVIYLYLKPCDVTITYDGNGNTGGSVPTSSTYTILDEATIKGNENSLTKTGKMFKGWSLRPDGRGKVYNPSDTFNIRGNMTLYAIWEDVSYSFTSGSNQIYTKGTKENKLFVCDGPLTNLTSVQIDGNEITETTQYTKESGSTKITLLGSYLENLALGNHTLKLTYSDGPTPTVTFNVVNSSSPNPSPSTKTNHKYTAPNTGVN